ncbi:hypothetical protein EJ110_NYTH23332 [Nymphaea thermarum]|nr:hypothetical protein EJ110_NYTH23332 [Nymphaea thermarum]
MGNYMSCSPIPFISSSRGVRVLSADGRVEKYGKPVKAAELMLQNPYHFICDARRLQAGRRIPAVEADQELKKQRLYFLLPVELLYAVLSRREIESLSLKASPAKKQTFSNNIGRIFPLLGELCSFPSQHKSKSEELSRERSPLQWRPSLGTIVESPQKP